MVKPRTPKEEGFEYGVGEPEERVDWEPIDEGETIEEPEPTWVMGEEKTPSEMVQGSELLDLKTELSEREEEAEEKAEIAETKRKIRRLKYKPAYDVAETATTGLKEGVSFATAKLKALKGTPEQRQARRVALKGAIKRVAKGSQGAMGKLGGFAGGGGMTAPAQPMAPEPKAKAKPHMTENMFGIGGGGGLFDMGGGGRNIFGSEISQKPGILSGGMETGSGLGTGLMGGDLLGGTGKGLMFSGNLLGGGQPARQVRRKPTKKRKTTKKKGKKRKGKKRTRRQPAQRRSNIMEPPMRLF